MTKSILDEGSPCGQFFTLQDTVVVGVKGLQDDAGVGGGKSGHGVAVLVIVQGSVTVVVNSIPVFDAKIVEESLGGLGHADVLGGSGGALGQLLAGDEVVTVSVTEVPEWLPLAIRDLGKSFERIYS